MLAIPASPPLPLVEAHVVDYLRAHRFTVPDGLTVTVTPLAVVASGALAGAQPLAEAAPGAIFASPVLAKWPLPYQLAALLHETLHETPTGGSYQFGDMTNAQMLANEQATETEMQDLLPALLRSVGYKPSAATQWAYIGLVKRERVASARACHCGWTTKPARAWRARFFFTNPTDRELIS